MSKFLLLLFSTLFLTACTTVNDFRNMTPHDRAEKICLKQANVKALMEQRSNLNAAILDSQNALSRGYRIHRQCYQVEVPGDSKTTCTSGFYGLPATCTTKTERRNKTQCDEKPVSISPDLERKNIDSWSSSLRVTENNLQSTWQSCYRSIVNLSADEAFKFY
jgi:hypothetical protein